MKSVLGSCSLIGSCCAIGVPIAMRANGGTMSDDAGFQVGFNNDQGGGQLTTDLDLDRCNSKGGRLVVPFGSPDKVSYCWKIQTLQRQIGSANWEESLNTLFKRMWEKGNQNWHSNSNNYWSSLCLKTSGNQWVLVGNNNTTENLGYCDQGAQLSKEASFLEIDKSEPQSSKIKFCWSDCWVEQVSASLPKQLEHKRENNWGLVEFYKK